MQIEANIAEIIIQNLNVTDSEPPVVVVTSVISVTPLPPVLSGSLMQPWTLLQLEVEQQQNSQDLK